MSDVDATQEELMALVEPATVPATPAAESTAEPEKPKRTRKSRAKGAADAGLDAYEAAIGETIPAPKTGSTRSRRSAKLTGSDVSAAIVLGTGIYAQLTQQGHWVIPEDESKKWAGELADLLNRIPSKYVRAATDMSGFLIVGTGIYASVKPRLDYSADLRREKAAIQRAAAMESTQVDPSGAAVDWGI